MGARDRNPIQIRLFFLKKGSHCLPLIRKSKASRQGWVLSLHLFPSLLCFSLWLHSAASYQAARKEAVGIPARASSQHVVQDKDILFPPSFHHMLGKTLFEILLWPGRLDWLAWVGIHEGRELGRQSSTYCPPLTERKVLQRNKNNGPRELVERLIFRNRNRRSLNHFKSSSWKQNNILV